MSSSAAEMKMCSISVAPMPSMMRSPVASWTSRQTDAGSASPAETARRRPASRSAWPAASIARYAVGAVNRTVTPCSATASASTSGVARLQQQHARAHAQREDHQAAEAEGEADRRGAGEHVVGLRAQHVRRERVGDGQDVAVEVHRRLRPTGGAGGEGQQRDVVGGGVDVGERGRLGRRPLRPGRRAAVEPKRTVVRPGIAAPPGRRAGGGRTGRPSGGTSRRSSRARRSGSSGMVVTATPPAFSTANQQATSHGSLGPRSSTRLPGTSPRSSTSTAAIWFACARSSP